MHNINEHNISTRCVHAGTKHDVNGAVVTPIYQVSTFKFENADHGARLFKGEEDGYIYTRMRNPTVEAMEDAVASLEGGAKAIGCGSGMAAVHLVFTHVLQAGDHLVCSNSVYGPTSVLAESFMTKFGIEVSLIDTSKLENIEKAMRPNTKLVYIETPGNPTLAITDIKGASDLAHKHNALICIDNTFMSPVGQSPFDLGVDIVLHSMTKFINGHADVVAGIVILKTVEDYKLFRKTMNLIGGVIDPFNSFLVHRGLKTLTLRVKAAQESTIKVAELMEKHPKVSKIWYPGLDSFTQKDLHASQSNGPGSMIALELEGGYEAGKKFLDNIEIFQLAVSLGGVESLVQHPASMTHAAMSPKLREEAGITDGLVRLSIGIEDCDEICAAVQKALDNL